LVLQEHTAHRALFRRIGLLLVSIALGACVSSIARPGSSLPATAAAQDPILDALLKREFDRAQGLYGERMRARWPAGHLETSWGQLVGQAGKMLVVGEPRRFEVSGMRVAITLITFEHEAVELKTVSTA
jgi:hypothetical protein